MGNPGSTLEHVSKYTEHGKRIGARFRELYQRLGWTQDTIADRSGDLISRPEVNRALRGGSQFRSDKIRRAMSRAFGLDLDQVKALIEGTLSVDDALKIIQTPKPPTGEIPTHNIELAAAIQFSRGKYPDDFLAEYAQTARRNGTTWDRETYHADIKSQYARRQEPALPPASEFETKPKLPKKTKR